MSRLSPKRILPFAAPLLLLAGLALVLTINLSPDRDPTLVPSALIDRKVPDFSLPGLTGAETPELTNADLRGGTPILVNFFASWCLPCRAEHPILMELARDHPVTVIGIAHRDKPDDAAKFLEDLGNPYRRIGVDLNGRAGIDWGVYGVPETYLVDGKGIIRWRWAGPLTRDIVDDELLPLIARLQNP